MFKPKKFRVLIIMTVLILALAGCGSSTVSKNSNKNITIATAGTGGAFYPIGAALAKQINNSKTGIRITNQASGGSVENVRLMENKEVEMAMLGGDSAQGAFDGTGEFQGKSHKDLIRGVFSMYSQPLSLVTFESSKINSFSDLKGKRIAVGAPGSGSEVKSKIVLEDLGLHYDKDVKQQYLSFAEAVEGMKDGHIDAAFVWAGLPVPAIQDLATVKKIKLISFTDEEIQKVIKGNSFMYHEVIPGGTYKGINEEIQTLAVNTQLVVRADVSEDTVYKFTKYVMEHLDSIHQAHKSMEELTKDTATNKLIQLHPGAEKYYKEAGILK
ncbi:TAXI family TRAP transporter solute-binding subunit [Neobacillus drentensis]|uniref:TAXI family TRAP transporter solute-binding subunit n=1 Tax=Neobacillus drentensis TaxID=220684 RepID=UPI000825E29A|nr:TAXI family TRAP transporter solute-binding subunit [Neobacillus drentensis]